MKQLHEQAPCLVPSISWWMQSKQKITLCSGYSIVLKKTNEAMTNYHCLMGRPTSTYLNPHYFKLSASLHVFVELRSYFSKLDGVECCSVEWELHCTVVCVKREVSHYQFTSICNHIDSAPLTHPIRIHINIILQCLRGIKVFHSINILWIFCNVFENWLIKFIIILTCY